MASTLSEFPKPHGYGTTKYSQFLDGSIWKLTNDDAEEFGHTSVRTLVDGIRRHCNRHGRTTRVRTLPDGVAIRVMTEIESALRKATLSAAMQSRNARAIAAKGETSAPRTGFVATPKPVKRKSAKK